MDDIATIGHNQPPEPTAPKPLYDVTDLADSLRLDYHHLYVRCDALKVSVKGWISDHPNGIQTDADAGAASDLAGQVLREVDVLDKSSSQGLRAEIGRPFLDGKRIVDLIFGNELAAPLRALATQLQDQLSAHIKRQRAEASRLEMIRLEEQRKEAALLVKAEAERLALLAEGGASDEDLDAAIAAEQAALDAAAAPDRPSVAPQSAAITAASRVTGDLGTTSHLAGRWKAEIVDPTLVPRQYCTPEQRLIDAAMRSSIPPGRGKAPTISIPGVQFAFEETARVRR